MKEAFHWFSENRFDLTQEAEYALTAVPLAILCIFGSVETWRLRNAKKRPRAGPKLLFHVKIALVIAAIALQVAYLGVLVATQQGVDKEAITLLVFVPLSALSIPFHINSYRKLQRSSTPLLFFWLTAIALEGVKLRTKVLIKEYPESKARLVLQSIGIALYFAVFCCECVGPESKPGQGYIRLPDEDVDSIDYSGREVPVEKANIFSRLTFDWMSPMMAAGYRKALSEEDLWALRRDDQADRLGEKFGHYWGLQREKARKAGNGKKPSLWIALAQSFGVPFFVAAIFKSFQDLLAFVQPQLLKRLLLFVETYNGPDPEPAYHGYTIAVLMFVCAIVQSFALHQYFARCFETGMRVRGGLIHAIYKKSLVLSNTERSGRATGDVVNLQSTDATRMADCTTYGQLVFSGSLQLILAFVSLYSLLGWYGLVGVGIMVLSIPANAFVSNLQSKMQRKQMKNKDQRTRIMSEILNNIRTIKLSCWENSFAQRLFAVRNDKELALLKRMGYLSSVSTFLWSFTPFAVGFSTFAVYAIVTKNPVTSSIAFPALALFQLITFPLAVLPNVITAWVEAYVSSKRLVDFLDAAELQSDAVEIDSNPGELKSGDTLVSVKDGSFRWAEHSAEPILQDINLTLKKGELVAVVGVVGSAKSSLLSAILGEMTRSSGKVKVRGSVAYISQSPWIMGGSVKDNITFGAVYEEDFYEQVLDACALREDLAILPNGDASEVGEKGLALSGGQKARLGLARAVYARADIYLFDDPLSAVDSHVGRHLFDRVIGPGGILTSKARLLCTNALPFVQHADEIIMLRRGSIVERGTFSETKGTDTEIGKLLEEFGKQETSDSGSDSDETAVQEESKSEDSVDVIKRKTQLRRVSEAIVRKSRMLDVREQKAETFKALKKSTRPKEHRETGSVKSRYYKKYLEANGILGVAFYIFSILANQFLSIMTGVWLKNWATHNSDTHSNGDLKYWLGIYFALGFGTGLMSLINGLALYSFCIIRSAKILHDGMFNSVIRAPMLFFETTPIGQVLNRFSRDVYVVDEVLARTFGGFFRTLAQVAGIIVVVSSAAPLYLVVVVPVFFLYRHVQKYYLATSRELKRLDATTKSPVFASFSETLSGLSTIRAFRQQERFIAENEGRLDRNQECYFPSVSCNRWLAVRLELMGSFLIFSAALLAVVSLVKGGKIDAGLVGLMITYSLSITQSLNWVVRSATEVETNIVSVERCIEYAELEPEAPLYRDDVALPDDWPSKGVIEFDHFSTRYRKDLDLVLKDLTFKVKEEEKIGVCGRTGAGKSSLSMSLFRIIEPAEGTIRIDGIDITKIGLHDLRSRLAIIPQDSQCFEGSLRQNIDPTGMADDETLWRVLDHARLKDHVKSMEGGLDAHVDEGGSNLSSGQRQLMCLARALLKRSKVLILDEATSQIDPESDKAIQTIIRTEFAKCTILTVAHRLNTIADSDRILTVDKGRLAEYDVPATLIANPTSIYYGLAQEAGIVGKSRPASQAPTRQGSPDMKS